MKKLALIFLSLCAGFAQAQTADDVELFQLRNLHGTPRFTAMGGAFTALGNDPSAYNINPAAAAVNLHSELSFGFGFNDRSGNYTNFYGQDGNERNLNVLFENVGLNLMLNKNGKNRFSLAFSTTKLADFNRDFNISQVTNNYTLGQYWAEISQGQHVDDIPWDAYSAWESFLLVSENDTVIEDGFAYGEEINGNLVANSDLSYTMNQDGSFNESNIVLGLDRGNKLYYGLSFGFPTLNFRREEFITEANLNRSNPPFSASSYTFRRLNDIYGTGFNMKFGIIYRPIPQFRFGASVQTSSWYTVNQFYEVQTTTNWAVEPEPGVGRATESPILETGQYAYRLRTPAIYRLGVATVLAKALVLSVDYQYQNQVNNRLYTNPRSFNITEDLLQSDYQPGIDALYRGGRQTLSAGAELRLKSIFLRAGYRLDESVYAEEVKENTIGDLNAISLGLGYKHGPWSFDIAYVNSQRERNYALYRGLDENGNSLEVIQDLQMTEISNNIIAGVTLNF